MDVGSKCRAAGGRACVLPRVSPYSREKSQFKARCVSSRLGTLRLEETSATGAKHLVRSPVRHGARRAQGASLQALVRQFLERLAGSREGAALVEQLERHWREADKHLREHPPKGYKFDREELYEERVDLHRLQRLSFWDALIVRSAHAGGCSVLLSEDMKHGQVFDGVRVENPFLR
jgi:hypothetical protein